MQAAPRQSVAALFGEIAREDAPRAGSAEAKKFEQRTTVFGGDAPRAGSAETKVDCSDRTEEG